MKTRRLLTVLIVGLGLVLSARIVYADTITVCASGCNYTTIQAAINAVSTNDGDTINVTAALHTEADIVVNKSVTITGASASSVTVQAHANKDEASDRVFTISGGATVTIQNMTIRHGKTTNSPAQGGGIYNSGTLTLQRVTVTANHAQGNTDAPGGTAEGGGIYNYGSLTIINSTISDNTALGGNGSSGNDGGDGRGGGIANGSSGTLVATNSTISGNTAQGGPGGG